jgi:hypothetical protein
LEVHKDSMPKDINLLLIATLMTIEINRWWGRDNSSSLFNISVETGDRPQLISIQQDNAPDKPVIIMLSMKDYEKYIVHL